MTYNAEQIKDALSKLNTEDDSLWTKEGLPIVDKVGLVGLTRKQITEVAPKFTRLTPTLGDEPLPPADEEDEREEDGAGDAPEVDEDAQGDNNPLPATPSELEAAEKEVAEAEAAFHLAEKTLKEKQAARDKLYVDTYGADTPRSTQQDIMDFIKKQNEQRAAKAARRNQLLDVGFDPSVLGKAPIDQAMSRKNSRGAQRPVRSPINGQG